MQEALELLFRYVKATGSRQTNLGCWCIRWYKLQSSGCCCRHSKLAPDSARSQQLAVESASAVAGLCCVFKACGRSCCLACLQLLKQPTSNLHAAVCAFLYSQLLAPIPYQAISDPDLEDHEPDRPCLAEEAFEQPALVDTLRAAVQHISGLLMHAACPVIACGPGWSWKACVSNDYLRGSLLAVKYSLHQTILFTMLYKDNC